MDLSNIDIRFVLLEQEPIRDTQKKYNMKKILISWWAPQTDFRLSEKKGKEVNTAGPNYEMHKYFFEGYDKHILLCSERQDDTGFEFLCNAIRRDFPKHDIDARYLALNSVIDFYEIKTKVEPLLWEHRDCQIHLFFSPGTSVMSIVWFLLHQQLGLDTFLLQTVRKEANADGKPKRLFLEFEKDQTLSSFLIRQTSQDEKASKSSKNSNYCLTESLIPVYEKASRIAQANRGNVLILGASGSGKENLAEHIHLKSARNKQPFITVNCAAFNDSLLESRLFGHKKGSFTGALNDSIGYFEQANGGTIFLDEIGDISPYMQQLLLRVMQHQEITPIGGKQKNVDVRIVAATNQDLVELCNQEKFRWDLYYRLATMELELPSLAERKSNEKEKLIEFFIKKKKAFFGKTKQLQLSSTAMQALMQYPFPGNVRELENLIEGFYVLGVDVIDLTHFPKRMLKETPTEGLVKLEDVEKIHIGKILKRCNNNLAQTAKDLGIALNTLKRKMEKFGI